MMWQDMRFLVLNDNPTNNQYAVYRWESRLIIETMTAWLPVGAEFVLGVCSNLVMAQVKQAFLYVSDYRSHFLSMLLEKARISLYPEWYSKVKANAKKGPSGLTDPETFGCSKMHQIKVRQHGVQRHQQFTSQFHLDRDKAHRKYWPEQFSVSDIVLLSYLLQKNPLQWQMDVSALYISEVMLARSTSLTGKDLYCLCTNSASKKGDHDLTDLTYNRLTCAMYSWRVAQWMNMSLQLSNNKLLEHHWHIPGIARHIARACINI